MEPNSQILQKLSQINNRSAGKPSNNLANIAPQPQPLQPLQIKTSKNWTLPPKPKPGRKPSASPPLVPSPAAASSSSTTHHLEIKPKPRKTYRKKATKEEAQLELALKKVKDENQMLKQELSKLVSDLKLLQQLNQTKSQQHSPASHSQQHSPSSVMSDSDLLSNDNHHQRKRNLSEMLYQDSQISSFINADNLARSQSVSTDNLLDLDDDVVSVVSQTPSLVSHNSSISSSNSSFSMNVSNSLSSIKEEQQQFTKPLIKSNVISKFSSSLSSPTFSDTPSSVKIDEFLTPLYDINETTAGSDDRQVKIEDDFEFQFLKDEVASAGAVSQGVSDYFNWD